MLAHKTSHQLSSSTPLSDLIKHGGREGDEEGSHEDREEGDVGRPGLVYPVAGSPA